MTHDVGSHYRRHAADIEDALIADYELPEGAASVSVSLDRTSLPMEEPRERPPGRRKKGEPRNPVSREFRMAWCATVTIHDRQGDALTTLRYGRMPKGDQIALCEALASDAEALLKKNPRLKIVTLADGAPDVLRLLDEHICRKSLGKPVRHLVDFWHVTEYLGAAAKPIGGDDAPKILASWKAWLRDDDNGVTKILGELRASGCADVRVGDKTPVADAIRYIVNHRRLMDYAAARRAHLPIGSGNVEATCKTLIGVRMKRCGSRWKEETGDDILRLRALALSDRWQPAMQLTFAKLRTAVRRAA